MVLFGPKRRILEAIGAGKESDQNDEGYQGFEKAEMSSGLNFPILELDTNIIYEILSRLPFRSILACKCACKTFFNLLNNDPYFIQLHLGRAPTTASLVFGRCIADKSYLACRMFDLDQGLRIPSCSIDCEHSICNTRNHSSPAVPKQNGEFCFLDRKATLVGECNGLLCLYSDWSRQRCYVICNPILGEYVAVPYLPPSTRPAYSYFNHSGFGYSPNSGQYKIIHFASLTSFDPWACLVSTEIVVDILTIGTDSWRRIHNVPCPYVGGSFDSLLNGSLHWLTDCYKPEELICAFNLENEGFTFLPSPSHFSMDYISAISGIRVGVIRGSLCLCYVYENSFFETWVMKDYGVKESWTKEFSIDIMFYSGVRGVDFHRPLKFLNNGELWLHCSFNRIVSYNPQTGAFKDFEVLGRSHLEVILHYPSFISLHHIVEGTNLQVMKDVRDRPAAASLA